MRLPVMVAAALLLIGGTAISHHGPRQAATDEQNTDIVVEGIREVGRDAMARARNPVPSARGHSIIAGKSAMFVRCAKRISRDQLSSVIDAARNSPTEQRALDLLIRANVACHPGYNRQVKPPELGICNPVAVEDLDEKRPVFLTTCRAFYDRGALLVSAINHYAPDIELTRHSLGDPAVQARFEALEQRRGRNRVPEDSRYYDVAVCLVRTHPELARRLINAGEQVHLRDQIGRLMLARAGTCVSGAKRVRAEPVQFQIYIADAWYRLALAAGNRASLLL